MYLHYCSSSYDIARNISHVKADRFLIHSHPYYELHFVISGDMEMLYAGQTVQVKPGGLTLIEADAPHGIRVLSEKPYERYTVHFTGDLLPEKSREILLRIFRTERFPARNNHLPGLGATNILFGFQELIRMCALPEDQRNILAPAMIQGLLTSIYVQMLDIVPLPERTGKSAVSAQEIRSYIDIRYLERLSLDRLAKVFYCSKGYLNTVFKKETGFSVMQYVLHRRLRYARALIENGYTAQHAGAMAGFPDYSNFYRAYVKHFGTAPSRNGGAEKMNAPRELFPVPQIRRARTAESGAGEPAAGKERKSIWELYHHDGRPDEDPAFLRDS